MTLNCHMYSTRIQKRIAASSAPRPRELTPPQSLYSTIPSSNRRATGPSGSTATLTSIRTRSSPTVTTSFPSESNILLVKSQMFRA